MDPTLENVPARKLDLVASVFKRHFTTMGRVGAGPGGRPALGQGDGQGLGGRGVRTLLPVRAVLRQLHHRHRPAQDLPGRPGGAGSHGAGAFRPAGHGGQRPGVRQQHGHDPGGLGGDRAVDRGGTAGRDRRSRGEAAPGQAGGQVPVHGQSPRAQVLPALPPGQRQGVLGGQGGLDPGLRHRLGPDQLRPVQLQRPAGRGASPRTWWTPWPAWAARPW